MAHDIFAIITYFLYYKHLPIYLCSTPMSYLWLYNTTLVGITSDVSNLLFLDICFQFYDIIYVLSYSVMSDSL